jgi:leader peptidase (prepilin peptidase)/N-methyltransferase
MLVADLPPLFLRTLAVIFGLLWGSFLNVVIHRLPLGLSVAFPGSHCTACAQPIRFYDNIPVVSYLVLRGKARCCGATFSPRYALVEALGGLLSLAILETQVLPQGDTTGLVQASGLFLAYFAVCFGLLAAAFIDAEHMYLPDGITLGGAILGVLTAPMRNLPMVEAFGAGIASFLAIWFPLIFLYERLRGRPGMGLGDAKLLMLAGAWTGLGGAAFTLLAGAVQGTLAALVIFLVKGKIEEPEAVRADREELQRLAAEGDQEAQQLLADDPLGAAPGEGLANARLPFGPFLILAFYEYLLGQEPILRAWERWMGLAE